jgi:hypothetical protein
MSLVQYITCQMSEPYRTKSASSLAFWLERGRELLDDPKATGSELRAASIGVKRIDAELSHMLAKRASALVQKFNQKYK